MLKPQHFFNRANIYMKWWATHWKVTQLTTFHFLFKGSTIKYQITVTKRNAIKATLMSAKIWLWGNKKKKMWTRKCFACNENEFILFKRYEYRIWGCKTKGWDPKYIASYVFLVAQTENNKIHCSYVLQTVEWYVSTLCTAVFHGQHCYLRIKSWTIQLAILCYSSSWNHVPPKFWHNAQKLC